MSPPNASSGQPRNFNGRVVLITGAGSGVGLECARVFATQGAKLLLVGRSADKLDAAAAELAETRAQTAICAGDVADSTFATTAMEAAREAFAAPVEVLINNAGVIVRRDVFLCDQLVPLGGPLVYYQIHLFLESLKSSFRFGHAQLCCLYFR